jgi:hypothetical protein
MFVISPRVAQRGSRYSVLACWLRIVLSVLALLPFSTFAIHRPALGSGSALKANNPAKERPANEIEKSHDSHEMPILAG